MTAPGPAVPRPASDPPAAGTPETPAGGTPDLLVRAVLSLYPQPWRDRYGDEFASLLTDLLACSAARRERLRLIASTVRGAADAHLNFPGGRAMTDRVRGSLGVVICALIAFAIAGAGFQKMTEDPEFTAAARQHAAIGTSFNVLRGAAFAAGIVVLAAAVPLLWHVLRQAIGRRRYDLLMLLAVPPVAIGAWLGIVRLILSLSAHPRVHSRANIAEAAVVVLLGAAVAALCGWSAVTILRRAELPDRLLRVQVIPMIAVTVCMAAVTVTDLSWGLAVHASDSALFRSSDGLLATYLPSSWAIGLVILAAATVVAARAAARAAGQLSTAAGS